VPKKRIITNLRWYIAGLLFLSTAINYVDRQALSFAFLKFGNQFHMDKQDFARIGSAFQLAYAVMPILSGKIIDLLGTRAGLSIFVFWWSAAGIATAGGSSVFSFQALRFALGLGEAGNWPGAVKAVAEWFPAKERAMASGIFNSGSSIGAVIAPLMLPVLIVTCGWRSAFVFTGALGFAWLVIWLLLYYAPEKHPHLSEEELAHICEDSGAKPAAGPPVKWIELFRCRQLWGLLLGRVLSDPVWWFYATWMPKYLNDARGVDLQHMPLLAAIPFFTAGLGGFAGGTTSSYLVKKGWSVTKARQSVLFMSSALMIAGIPAVRTATTNGSVAFMAVATFAYASFAANLIAVVTDVFPKYLMASVYGIATTVAGFAGMGFTLLAGKLPYVQIFTLAGVLPLVAATVFITMIGRVQHIELRRSGSAEVE